MSLQTLNLCQRESYTSLGSSFENLHQLCEIWVDPCMKKASCWALKKTFVGSSSQF